MKKIFMVYYQLNKKLKIFVGVLCSRVFDEKKLFQKDQQKNSFQTQAICHTKYSQILYTAVYKCVCVSV